MELSDDEVLAFPERSSEEESSFSDSRDNDGDQNNLSGENEEADDLSLYHQGDEDGDEINGWGSKKADYYDADAIENEEDAAAEEAEARRLQDKRLRALKAADYGFDEMKWLDATKPQQDEARHEVEIVAEKLPRLKVTEHMDPVGKLNLLNTAYPECEPLAHSLLELLPLYSELSHHLHFGLERPLSAIPTPLDAIKFVALSSYLAAMALYFAILTSTAKEGDQDTLPLLPTTIHNHGLMKALVSSREIWNRIKCKSSLRHSLDSSHSGEDLMTVHSLNEIMEKAVTDGYSPLLQSSIPTSRLPSDQSLASIANASVNAHHMERLRRTEASLASFTKIAPANTHHLTNAVPLRISDRQQYSIHDQDSELGDEASLAPYELEAKSRRKKSLRFYTSQIAQRENKRANAGRAAGGDDDLPYRERFRDRQARLTKDAERRGLKSQDKPNESDLLRNDETDEHADETNEQRERKLTATGQYDDRLADSIELQALGKKAAKAARDAAYTEAREAGGRVVPQGAKGEGAGASGRRELTYAIEKNKGLMPRRKKEVKNPRVKKRKRFEDKTRKLRSMKSVYTGGEAKSGYAGELTGINKGLVRSTKF